MISPIPVRKFTCASESSTRQNELPFIFKQSIILAIRRRDHITLGRIKSDLIQCLLKGETNVFCAMTNLSLIQKSMTPIEADEIVRKFFSNCLNEILTLAERAVKDSNNVPRIVFECQYLLPKTGLKKKIALSNIGN